MARHHLPATPETCKWGFLDAKVPPAIEIESGDEIEIDTVTGAPDVVPGPDTGFHVPPELAEIHEKAERHLPGHILTGPVAVKGAEPGDSLEIRFKEIRLRQDWGFNFIRPLAGTLPDDFPEPHLSHIALDAARGVGRLPWGLEVPLAPFFGVVGVAPPPNWGRLTSLVPRAFGGNLDLKELVVGSTLHLPVFVPGANLSVGDGHGAQGDGEVNVTAIETALAGVFEIRLHKGRTLTGPLAETPEHWITLGIDPDLDRCAETALRRMIALIVEKAGLTREQAYTLCSIAADLRVTQTVNGAKGVHCMLRKALIA